MDDLVDIYTSSALKGLRPLLSSWTQVVLEFCKDRRHSDNPWWYNERASLSVLAGAAWRMPGWTALEEFSTRKRGKVLALEGETNHEVRGRCDIHVSHRTTSFAIEAKQAWQPISGRARNGKVEEAMLSAWNDAGCLNADEGDHRLALTVIAPFIALKEVGQPALRGDAQVDEKSVRSKVEAWLKTLDTSEFDAYAYVFPRRAGGYVNRAQTKVFPGAYIAIQRRQKANKRAAAGG